MPSEKRDRQRQNRAGGRAADLEAARAAKKRKSARNAGIAVAVVAAAVILLAFLNSGGDDDENVAASDTTSSTVADDGEDGEDASTTTTGETDTSATTATTAAPAGGGNGGGEVTCNDREPANPPSDKQFDEPGDAMIDPAKTYTVTMETSCGNIVLELFPEQAPETVNNFVFLARQDFYDGTKFHRVVEDFVIQGGDPEGTGSGGPGYDIGEEPPEDETYEVGDFAMAKTSAPNSTGSQFFVVTGDPGPLNQSPTYSLFGKVTEGLDVAQKLESFAQPDQMPSRELWLFDVTVTES